MFYDIASNMICAMEEIAKQIQDVEKWVISMYCYGHILEI